ncbi:c-type cytochrome [Flagellimonas flava]|uniref:Cytochrome c, mono-and diheme variants n=1 Tax=Flagellimonas flava TaxID=570519 RepID=A0A1M5PP78_9FLAO|nr:cytochrome c [Allomuricauda flava]SHH03538.1 Cytochrome c, mono-and diheme variants [Allomuricauda flava]
MRTILKGCSLLFLGLLVSCGGKQEKKQDGFEVQRQKATENTTKKPEAEGIKASERIDLSNKGVGPVTSVDIPETIDPALADQGKAVYDQMCLACHRVGKKFIGPAPDGILERRTPEWVMNMILNPEGMVKEDPLAKDLLIEFNGSPMANQGLTEEQARAVLEYFRTL